MNRVLKSQRPVGFEIVVGPSEMMVLMQALMHDSRNIPKPGFEVLLASQSHGRDQIRLRNTSGKFLLASNSTPAARWTSVFGEAFAEFTKRAIKHAQKHLDNTFIMTVGHFFQSRILFEADVREYGPRYTPGKTMSNDDFTEAALRFGTDKALVRWSTLQEQQFKEVQRERPRA